MTRPLCSRLPGPDVVMDKIPFDLIVIHVLAVGSSDTADMSVPATAGILTTAGTHMHKTCSRSACGITAMVLSVRHVVAAAVCGLVWLLQRDGEGPGGGGGGGC